MKLQHSRTPWRSAVAAAMMLWATSGTATLLVPNSSFESPNISGGAIITPTGWAQFGTSNEIMDFDFGAVPAAGLTGTQADILNDNYTFGAPSDFEPTDLYVGIGSPDSNLLSLTMTVDAARRTDGVLAGGFTYGIWLDLVGGDGIPDTALSTTYITPATILLTGFTTQAPVVTGPILAGTQLYARFQADDIDDVNLYQTLLDNVQLLEVVQIPEPSTILLFGVGGLLVWRRRGFSEK